MISKSTFDLIIVGGGLAGLTTALDLSRLEISILVIEKHEYPHHRVCGEYISNEVLPYLKELGIDPFDRGAKTIRKFEMSTKDGKLIKAKLPLGGFGISRYAIDYAMYKALNNRVEVVFDTVTKVAFNNDQFEISTQSKASFSAKFVVGAYGKRSNLDLQFQRPFLKSRSPWLGVKAHFIYDFPEDVVALHNFEGGYCGLSQVETGAVNACYFKSFKPISDIENFQKTIMSKNPYLEDFFSTAKPLFKKPLTISQISFEEKEPVFEHIFMIGDSAGLIHPLCGNGMAMAIHSAKIFSEIFSEAMQGDMQNRTTLEELYIAKWKSTFMNRLKSGRRIQSLLLNPTTTKFGFKLAQLFPSIVPKIIKKTHGQELV